MLAASASPACVFTSCWAVWCVCLLYVHMEAACSPHSEEHLDLWFVATVCACFLFLWSRIRKKQRHVFIGAIEWLLCQSFVFSRVLCPAQGC